jgi:hypothetical protein
MSGFSSLYDAIHDGWQDEWMDGWKKLHEKQPRHPLLYVICTLCNGLQSFTTNKLKHEFIYICKVQQLSKN